VRQVDIVTGAAGFIGSHLSEVLIARGSHVIGVDNLAVGQMQNIAHLLGDNFSFFNRDIREIEDIELSQMRTENLRIFHLAALADIVPSIEQPQDYFESNVRGTLKVLELARKLKAKKFILLRDTSKLSYF
jgi:UDP-glucose 4-epimerase